jgi:hypothetical protein
MATEEAEDLGKLVMDTIREVAQILLSSGCSIPPASNQGMYEVPCEILLELTKERGTFSEQLLSKPARGSVKNSSSHVNYKP